jgi:hypothetical protein
MTRTKGLTLALSILLTTCLGATASTWAASEPDWVIASNKQAAALLEETAKYSPEAAASVGVEGHDG